MKLTTRLRRTGTATAAGLATAIALAAALLSPTAAAADTGARAGANLGPVVTGSLAHAIAAHARPASSRTIARHTTDLARPVTGTLTTPTAGAAGVQVAVTGGGNATVSGAWQQLGSSGVALAPLATTGKSPVAGVSAALLSRQQAATYGLDGVVLKLTRTDTATTTGMVGVEVPQRLLEGVYGAGYASRVRWVQVTAPKSRNPLLDPFTGNTLAAATPVAATPVSLGHSNTPVSSPTGPVTGAALLHTNTLTVTPTASITSASAVVTTPALGAKTILLAAVSSPSSASGAGSFGATPINAAALWDVSAQTGDFSWNLPMAIPPAAAGPTPQLGLTYSSQAVDGETGSSNNQPSPVGEGWTLGGGGSITRAYESCSLITGLTGAFATAAQTSSDQCWAGDNATLNLGGHSGLLIQDGANQWHVQNDDGTRLQHVVGSAPGTGDVAGCAANGTYDTDCWVATTTDGTQYYFGLNQLPGYTSGNSTTNSAWTVPVYATSPGQPCYNAASFAASSCMQGWQWNLDYVVDVHGNAEALYYDAQTNNYAQNNSTPVSYTRGGVLDHIDYGFRNGDAYKTNAASDKVLFGYDANGRCLSGCSSEPLSGTIAAPATPASYPDVPFDLNCTSGACTGQAAPSFYSTSMLDTVTTQALVSGAYKKVDVWTLGHSFPDPGDTADGTTAELWLTQVSHTGYTAGTPVTEPATVFTGEPLQNRVWTNGYAPLMKYRIASILTSLGAVVSVNYAPVCSVADAQAVLSAPSTNHHPCYPQWWTPPEPAGVPAPQPVQDVFNKYTVASTTVNPETGGGTDSTRETDYVYTGTPAWRSDIAPQTPTQYKTYSDFAGYSAVEVRQGAPGASTPQTATDYTFFQGLGGTMSASSTMTAAVGYTPQYTDNLAFAGQTFEARVLNGVGGAVVSDTMTAPTVVRISASNTAGQRANMVRPSTSITAEPVSSGGWRYKQTSTTYSGVYALPATVSTYSSDGDTNHGFPMAMSGVPGGETCTTNTYAAANTTAWITSALAETSTVGLDCARVASLTLAAVPSNLVISDTRTYYDGSTTLGAAPSRGDVTRTDKPDSFTGTTYATENWKTFSSNAYDAFGRITSSTDVLGNTTGTAYSPSATAAAGSGALTSETVTNPLGWTTTSTVDPQRGTETAVTDVNGNTTTASYDSLGRRTSVWLANNPQASAPHDPSLSYTYTLSPTTGNSIATTTLGQTGASTTYSLYDGIGNLIQTQAPTAGPSGGAVITDTAYNTAGQVSFTDNAYWEQTAPPSATRFDPASLQEIPSQQVTGYDGAGRPTTVSVVSNATTRFTTTTAYPGADRTDITPPAGGTPTSTYTNTHGEEYKLVQYTGPSIGSGTALTSSYMFTPAGDMASMTDPSANTWSWTYNVLRQKTQAVDPDTGTLSSSFDDAGNLLTTTDARGIQLSYTYDTLNRETGIYQGAAGAGSLLTSTVYDTLAKGQITSTTSYAGSTPGTPGLAYRQTITGYTALNQPTGTTTSIPAGAPAFAGTTYTTSQKWNADQTLGSQTDPAAGGLPAETLKYEYDPQHLLNSITGATLYISNIGYSGINQVDEADSDPNAGTNGTTGTNGTNGSPNGMYRTYGYDIGTGNLLQDQDQSVTATGSYATLANRTYTRNDAGNITSISTTATGVAADTQCFSYDGVGELTTAWTPNSSSNCQTTPSSSAMGGPAPYLNTYTVNPGTGNRTASNETTTAGTENDTYTYPAAGAAHPHAVTTITRTGTNAGTASYGYDAAGNTTTRPGQTLTYDPQGRIATTTIGGITQTNVYDGTGQLLLQTDPTNGSTLYLGDTQLHQTPSGSTTGTRTYTGPTGPIAERATTTSGPGGGTLYWLGTDTNNTSTIELNATTGAVTRRYIDPYGNSRGTTATWSSPNGYLNALTNPTTGTTQLGARAYDPTIGKFLTVDSVLVPTNPQQNNGYAYSGNSPITQSDPSGQCYSTPTDSLNFHTNCVGSSGSAAGNGPAYVPHDAPLAAGNSSSDYGIYHAVTTAPETSSSKDSSSSSTPTPRPQAAPIAPSPRLDNLYSQKNTTDFAIAAAVILGNAAELCEWGDWAEICAEDSAAGFDRANALAADSEADDAAIAAEEKKLGTTVNCGGESFTPDTSVLLANGTTEPISDIKPGDTVTANNMATNTKETQKVTTVWAKTDNDLLDLTVTTAAGASIIHTTEKHPIWDQTQQQWVNAAQLPTGDKLRTSNGTIATITKTQIIPGSRVMWDLTVTVDHDFYVMAATESVLVHNCPVDPRDVHGELRAQQRDIDTGKVIDSGQRFVQDDGQSVHILDRGNGTSDVVVRPFDSPGTKTYVQNLTNQQIARKFASGRWYDPYN